MKIWTIALLPTSMPIAAQRSAARGARVCSSTLQPTRTRHARTPAACTRVYSLYRYVRVPCTRGGESLSHPPSRAVLVAHTELGARNINIYILYPLIQYYIHVYSIIFCMTTMRMLICPHDRKQRHGRSLVARRVNRWHLSTVACIPAIASLRHASSFSRP